MFVTDWSSLRRLCKRREESRNVSGMFIQFLRVLTRPRESSGTDLPDERWLGLAARVPKVQNQGEIAVVNGNAGDINDAPDALLQ